MKMSYKVDLRKKAHKSLKKLDKHVANKIINWIDKNLEGCENPRLYGKALKGKYKGKWRYEVLQNYRIIAIIKDKIDN